MAERREGDVFFSGVLLYKPGTWTSQKYTAMLKFESISGMKRLDLYPIHGNKRVPGSPSSTILLTRALGVADGKQNAISRAKHTFQIMSPGERHQLSARSEVEKMEWITKLNQIINHMPVDNRTYKFHVTVSPTSHSDNLQLKGQYILKISETEIHLFSASGAIASKFWSPLGGIRSASHYVIPISETRPQHHGMGGGAWGGGHRHTTTQRLLVITTAMTSPIGEGGFAFFTDSAKDIAASISHRKEMRLQNRLAVVSTLIADTDHNGTPVGDHSSTPVDDHSGTPVDDHSAILAGEPDTERRNPPGIISTSFHKKKFLNRKSLPNSPSTEGDTSGDSSSSVQEGGATHTDGATGTGKPALVRKCARRYRVVPMSHQLEKSKSQLKLKLKLSDPNASSSSKDSLFSPDEPMYVTNAELAGPQDQFREWKKNKERAENDGSGSELSLTGQQLRQKWMRGRSSTISTPEERKDCHTTALSSQDGDYVSMSRWWGEGGGEEDSALSETSLGKLRGLERQQKIDTVSPSGRQHEREFFNIRPRTNAFSELSPASPLDRHPGRQVPIITRQQSTRKEKGGREMVWQCDDDMCTLVPRAPNLAALPQKSGSDPQLSSRRSLDLTNSHEYLTILPPNLAEKRAPKKPKPTPRKQLPSSLPLYENDIHMTLPTPTADGRERRSPAPSPTRLVSRLDVQRLLFSQRSLSESNLYDNTGGGSTDDDYVDMTSYHHRPRYTNHNDLQQNPDSSTSPDLTVTSEPESEVMTFERRMRSQSSCSVGDVPLQLTDIPHMYENSRCIDSLLNVQDLYENGGHVRDYYLHGNTGDKQVDHGNETELGSHGDSGLGSTPSCSPLLASIHRSYSLGDVRQTNTPSQQVADTTHHHHHHHHHHSPTGAEKPRAARRKPCKWQLPCCTKAVRSRKNHTHYENLPLIPSL